MLDLERLAPTSDVSEQFRLGNAEASDNVATYLRGIFIRRFSAMGIETHDAEDLAQQCLVDIFSCMDRFDPERGSLDAWASGVARNVLRNWWRRSKIQAGKETSADMLLEVPAPEPVEVDATAAVAESMNVLSVIDRELIHMRFALGMSFSEIAASSDLTEVNARKRVSRAVEQLRRQPAIQQLLS